MRFGSRLTVAVFCTVESVRYGILDRIGFTQYRSCCNISKPVNFNVETAHRPQALYTSCSCKVSSTMEQTQPQIVTIWSVKENLTGQCTRGRRRNKECRAGKESKQNHGTGMTNVPVSERAGVKSCRSFVLAVHFTHGRPCSRPCFKSSDLTPCREN